MQRRDFFVTALYLFHKGYWCSIPKIIWRQLHKFWEGVHQQAADTTRSWGLPFPFLITYMLRKKGIKGISTDGPIGKHPQFDQIQWNQSYSHMPQEHQARAANGVELMDMDEAQVEEEAAEEEEVKQEETITISVADY
jgi:hypothetical protein